MGDPDEVLEPAPYQDGLQDDGEGGDVPAVGGNA